MILLFDLRVNVVARAAVLHVGRTRHGRILFPDRVNGSLQTDCQVAALGAAGCAAARRPAGERVAVARRHVVAAGEVRRGARTALDIDGAHRRCDGAAAVEVDGDARLEGCERIAERGRFVVDRRLIVGRTDAVRVEVGRDGGAVVQRRRDRTEIQIIARRQTRRRVHVVTHGGRVDGSIGGFIMVFDVVAAGAAVQVGDVARGTAVIVVIVHPSTGCIAALCFICRDFQFRDRRACLRVAREVHIDIRAAGALVQVDSTVSVFVGTEDRRLCRAAGVPCTHPVVGASVIRQ